MTTDAVGADTVTFGHWPYDRVSVAGEDAGTYLHSQLSQDIRALAVGSSVWSFVLAPNGRIDALVLVLRTADDAFELRVDRDWGESLVARLNRFRIRVRAEVAAVGSHEGDAAAHHIERVAAGWPAMGVEITEASIPAEFPEVVRAAVSFTKGCYPGQELVERMDSRSAEAPRHLERLVVGADARVGDPVLRDGAQVGSITSIAAVGDQVIALALVRRRA